MNNRLMFSIFMLCLILVVALGYRLIRDHVAAPPPLKVGRSIASNMISIP